MTGNSWDCQHLIEFPHYSAVTVRSAWTVPWVLPGSTLESRGEPVLATGYLIALLEDATWQAAITHVPEHLSLLGVDGTYHHTGPAVPGQQLALTATCLGGHGTRTRWRASAHTDTHQVGVLEHTLVATDATRFHQRLAHAL